MRTRCGASLGSYAASATGLVVGAINESSSKKDKQMSQKSKGEKAAHRIMRFHNPLTEADLQAVADLVTERDRASPVAVSLRNTRNGKAYHEFRLVTVPMWALKYGDDYTIYYVIHEVAHIVYGKGGHGEGYKAVEDRLLSYWELSIKRARAYPRTVYSRGQVVYSKVKTKRWIPLHLSISREDVLESLSIAETRHPRTQFRIVAPDQSCPKWWQLQKLM